MLTEGLLNLRKGIIMGAPKSVRPFSVKEMSELLSQAKTSALRFRSVEARVEALEAFRLAILPFTNWLDRPIKECFVAFDESAYRHAPKRALRVFKQYGNDLHVVALDRHGNWMTVERVPTSSENLTQVRKLSSAALAAKIDETRIYILDSIPWPLCSEHLKTIESLGLRPIISHCAFLKYLKQGIEELEKTLAEREERMRILRGNLTFLASFATGLDPLVQEPKEPLNDFAVFAKRPGYISRCSGTYFIQGPVQEQVNERNAKRQFYPDMSYYVYESKVRVDELGSLLRSLHTSVGDIKETMSSDARKPISKEEAAIIKQFADSIGTP